MLKVVHVMSSKILGGVEQAFLDYTKAIITEGHEVLSITSKNAKINSMLLDDERHAKIEVNFALNGILSIYKIYKECKKFGANIIITHSKKTIAVLRLIANLLKIKLVVVAHNDKFKHLNRADAIFSITQYQKDVFIEKGFPKDNIFVIPNMIENIPEYKERNLSDIITFGTMGRFDKCKGFGTFLKSLKILKDRGYKFKARIGGGSSDKTEEEELYQMSEEYNLTQEVEFLGWIKEKDKFYNNIDIFVLPSHYEPFGIVLLEAMSCSLPIISSTAKGPKEIFSNNEKASLMFENKDENALANQMIYAIENKDKLKDIAQNGYNLCKDNYSMNSVSKKLIKNIGIIK